MKRVPLMFVTLLMTNHPWKVFPDSTNKSGIDRAAGVALANGHGLTAIEVHQGGQDGGGALWYSTATAPLFKTY